MNINPVEQLEKDREDQERKLKKMEKEMEQVFEMKVKEKKKKLKDTEGEVTNFLTNLLAIIVCEYPFSKMEEKGSLATNVEI